MKVHALVYGFWATLSAGFAVYLGNGSCVQILLGRPPSFYIPALVATFVLVIAAFLLGVLAFLHYARFLEKIQIKDGELVLFTGLGQQIALFDNIRLVKEFRGLFDFEGDQIARGRFTVLRANQKLWLCRTATYRDFDIEFSKVAPLISKR